jgi:hypothetical protein
MKNSEAVMEHLTEGTPALPLHNAICIFQDVANYKSEERLTDFTCPSQLQIDSPGSVGCPVYLRSEHNSDIDEAIFEISLRAG